MSWQKGPRSFWLSGAHDASPAVSGELQVDTLVVGGGLAGLSTAYHLKQRLGSQEVAIVEADVVGGSGSGANSGQAAPRVGPAITKLVQAKGDAYARSIFAHSLQLVESVAELIAAEEIACDAERNGQICLATTKAQARRLEGEALEYQRLGFDVRYIDRAELDGMLGTDRYRAGLLFPTALLLDPGKLCRGLRDVVVRQGVKVFENSPITKLSGGATPSASGEGFTIKARNIVLATNGFVSQLGLFLRQVVPYQTAILLTAPLGEAALLQLKWKGRQGFYDARNIFNYFRLTADNRLLFGGGYRQLPLVTNQGGYVTEVSREVEAELHRELLTVFPYLHDVELTHRWSGVIGMTLDRFPIITAVPAHDNVFYLGAWNGHGVAQAVGSGAIAAEMIQRGGQTTAEFPWIRKKGPSIPPLSIASPLLRTYVTTLRWADQFGAARDRVG